MGGSRRPRPAIPVRFRWVREDVPGPAWKALFDRAWPSYHKWFLREGDRARPTLRVSRAALAKHMPELVPVYEQLVACAGGGRQAARLLSLYRPTPYVTGCSQAVWSRGAPLLVRNYDFHPAAHEGVFLHSAWSGTRTIVASDCLWGALDGMNEHGLVVSLAFGGRREVGDGFGIPLILRYALETCTTVPEACDVFERVPSHMSYNVTLLDSSGKHAVAVVAPDRKTRILDRGVATNHQHGDKWTRYHEFTCSADRARYLEELVANPRVTAEGFERRFLRAPLYSTRWERAFGTIYTSAYRPAERMVRYHWPSASVEQSFDRFEELERDIRLGGADASGPMHGVGNE